MKHTRIFLLLAVVFVLALTLIACAPEHQHTWVDADCDTPKTCSECGETEGEALGHAVEELVGKPATCTEAGLTDGTKCSVCGEIVEAQTEIEKLPHTEEVIAGKPVSCGEAGLTDGKKCSVCGDTLVAQEEIPATGHVYEIKAVIESTCTVAGKTVYECSCGDSYEEALELADHNYSPAVTAPDCVNAGYTTYTCSCGESYVADEVEALGHSYSSVVTAPTCTEIGYTTYTCACGASYVADEVAALGHSYKSVVTAPTCTENGYTTYTCACGHSYVADEVPARHIDEIVAAVAPTCTETGLTEGKKCSVCGVTTLAQQLVPANGHKDDNSDFECDVCHTDLCTDHVASAPAEENRVEPSCTEAGYYYSVVKCNNCGEELSREMVTIPVLPHTPGAAATCTEAQNCTVCNTELNAALGHTEALVAGKAPTCTETGLTDGKQCSVCGVTLLAQDEIPANGHSYSVVYQWSEDNSTCTSSEICAVDPSHVGATETVTVSKVVLNVTASNVTYTYFAGEQTKSVDGSVELINNIATINAPAIAGRVASHDYVKFSFHDAAATYTFTIYYSEVDVWDGVSVSEDLAGSGTAEDPYLIQSAADLAYIAKVVNALEVKTAAFSGNYIVMTKSIDLNGYELHIGTGRGWNDRQMFAAHLDGNNCTIRGINNTLPLFGCIEGGSVKNLSLYGEVNVAKGNDSTGVFVGYLRLAPMTNVTNYATMNGRGNVGGIVGNMEQSNDNPSTYLVNYGAITGVQNVGGIAGLIGRKLENCTNWGTVSGDHDVGGVVGNLYWACSLTSCNNYGTVTGNTVVGGIAGTLNGSISATLTGCVNYGNVSGTTCTSTAVDAITTAGATKTDCVNNGSVVIPAHEMTYTDAKAATCEADGNVAYNHCSVCNKNYDADGKEIANIVIAALGHAWDNGVAADGKITYTCGNCGNVRVEDAKSIITVNYLNIDGTVAAEADAVEASYNEIATIYAKSIEGYVPSHDYVKLLVQGNTSVTIYYSEVSVWDGTSVSASLSGTGTEADPFLIQSAADFAYFAAQVNANTAASGSNYKVTTFKGQYFKMTKSIDLNGNYLIVGMHAGWNNYQGFFGHFNGNNCSIRGINLDGSTGSSSTALFGCVNTGSIKNLSIYGSVKGNAGAAGLVGYTVTNAVIENVTSYVNVTSKVGNGRQGTVGGIVANQENSAGALLNCVNYGTVTCDSYIVGGIVGSGGATMTNCVNWGDVTGGNVSVGGISGSTKDKGTITGCVNYGTVTGATTAYGQIGGIVGTAKKAISDCANYGTVIGTTSKGVGQIYGTTTTTVTNCVENGEVKEYVAG